MKLHKYILIVAIAIVLGALQLDGVAHAIPVPIPEVVAWRYRKTDTVDPGKVWMDESGLHIRGRVEIGVVSGDIQGIARVEYNADLVVTPVFKRIRPAPNNGTAYGTMEIWTLTLSEDRAASAWRGIWTHEIEHGKVVSGSMTAVNAWRGLFMRIESVSHDIDGSLLHKGTIEPLFCLDLKCPGPIEP